MYVMCDVKKDRCLVKKFLILKVQALASSGLATCVEIKLKKEIEIQNEEQQCLSNIFYFL